MLPGILPRCLLMQKQVYFLLAQPQLGAEDTHVNKIPARVHKPEGDRAQIFAQMTTRQIPSRCLGSDLSSGERTLSSLWENEKAQLQRHSSSGFEMLRFCQVEMVVERARESRRLDLRPPAQTGWGLGRQQGAEGKSVILCAGKHWSKPTKLTLVLWEPGMCGRGDSSLSFFNHRKCDSQEQKPQIFPHLWFWMTTFLKQVFDFKLAVYINYQDRLPHYLSDGKIRIFFFCCYFGESLHPIDCA